MGKETLGEFEHHVLLATLRLGGEGYSTSIVLELEDRIGRSVAPAAVYIALRRLETNGLVHSRLAHSDRGAGGRTRRYFEVTAEGRTRLLESRRRLDRLWEGLDPRLEEG